MMVIEMTVRMVLAVAPISFSLSRSIMAVSLESSPNCLRKEQSTFMNSSSSPLISPTSDKEFWSALRNRVDTLLENRKLDDPFTATDQVSCGANIENSKRLRKEDCLLLLRGFDSISSSLSQLTGNLDTAVNQEKTIETTYTANHRSMMEGRFSVSDIINFSNSEISSRPEGTLRSWESSTDLVNVLKNEIRDGQLSFRGKQVLEGWYNCYRCS